jgi:hypothetical protein
MGAGDQGRHGAARAHGRHQLGGARVQGHAPGRVVERRGGQAGELCHACVQRFGEVELAGHGARGDRGDGRAQAHGLGELVQHLLADDGRFQVGDQQGLAPPPGGLRGEVECRAPQGFVSDPLGGLRRQALERQVAGLGGRKPIGRAGLGAGRGERAGQGGNGRFAEARPLAAGNQGEDKIHGSPYRRGGLVSTFRIGWSVIVFSYVLVRKRRAGDAGAHRRAPLTRPGLAKKRPFGRASKAPWWRCATLAMRRHRGAPRALPANFGSPSRATLF